MDIFDIICRVAFSDPQHGFSRSTILFRRYCHAYVDSSYSQDQQNCMLPVLVCIKGHRRRCDVIMSLIQRMRRLYRRCNPTFGYIIFLNCVRDLTAMVALMSIVLRTNEPERPGEDPEDYDSRIRSREIKERVYLCQTVISVANALVRSFICVYSQKQVLNKYQKR